MKNEIQPIELVIVAIGLCSLYILVMVQFGTIAIVPVMFFCLSVLAFMGALLVRGECI